MLRIWCIAIALGSLPGSAALADMVNVSVNGTVSGSGSVTNECFPGLTNPPQSPACVEVYPGLYLDTIPFSFNATNTN
jgi:hypothetical protein